MSTISIPTIARGSVRAFVKSHPKWFAWIVSKGKKSNEALNSDILDFAHEHGLMDEVLVIIQKQSGAAVANPVTAAIISAKMNEGLAKTVGELVNEVPVEVPLGQISIGDILKGVDQFLSPLVRKELETALKPVIDAANKPPVVQEVERIVQTEVLVDKQGTVIRPKAPAPVLTGKKVPFNKLFGTSASGDYGRKEISLWNSHGYAPEIDQFYVVDHKVMGMIALAAECGDYVWQVGPSGSGKTTNPKQFAAYTGRRFFHIQCTKHTEVADLVGGDGAKDGNTFWQDGALIEALKVPGAVILIDEPSLVSPGVQAIFQAVTNDSREYTIHATGEVVKLAPGVFIIVGDNTNGSGDETGVYAGTHQCNAALVNRFRRMVKVDYMTKSQEAKALVNWTQVPLPAAEHVVDFFSRARKLPEMEGIVMSLRQMTGFVRTVKDGFTSKDAFEVAILNKLPATERAAVEALATLDWHVQFDAALTGAVLTNQPSNSAGARAFDDGVVTT